MAETPDYTLLPSRQRQVATALQAAGLNPRDFAWEQAASFSGSGATISRLVHVPTGYSFQFDWAKNGNRPVRVRPGRDAWREDVNFASVDEQLEFFVSWLDVLIDQLSAGDPATEFAGAEHLFEEAAAAGSEAFDETEREEIVKRLEAIRTVLLEKAADDESAREQTNERIDYLKDALDRLGKRDWYFMAFGILLERGFEFALPNDQIRALLEMLARGVQLLTGG